MRRPIEPYCRVPIVVREADPRAREAAARVIALIAARHPGAEAEHVGSSAVPGLAGKGTIDLLLPTSPDEIPAVTRDLLDLGFQRQAIPTAFPPTRPMLQGVIRHDGTSFRVHVHVVPESSPEVPAIRGFRDALLADPALREEYVLEVISAHRDPRRVADYAASAVDRGLQVIIAAAGKAAALPGVVAAHTTLPVIGLPIYTPQLGGLVALSSMVQMPSGVPVATVGLDAAVNAGILALQILAVGDERLRGELQEFKDQLAAGLRL